MTRQEAIDMVADIDRYLTAGNPLYDVDRVHEALTIAVADMDWISKMLGYVQTFFNPGKTIEPKKEMLSAEIFDMDSWF
jgi:hypothetical protein